MVISTFLTDSYLLLFSVQLSLFYMAILYNSPLVTGNIIGQINTSIGPIDLYFAICATKF